MLPYPAQQRLLAQAPDEYTLQYALDDGSYEGAFDIDSWWAREDLDPDDDASPVDYPALVFDIQRAAVLSSAQSIGDTLGYVDADDPAQLDELRGRRVYDEVSVTMLTAGHHEPTATSAGERIKQLVPPVYRHFAFTVPRTLRTAGDAPGEIPLTIRQGDVGEPVNVSELRANTEVAGYQFTLTCRYLLTDVATLDAVAGFDIQPSEGVHGGERTVEIRYEP
ncbi:hypothetical protein [Halomarina oriensis]|uniref:Uncharacterized protein n=1 Tax=Halomarina oriensis TaxID=671145 RepID=A0A6B0GP47_9EURY|nr:hypothetical protein [Halomarina oriensis]MWG36470.1 hypothetical protein [Halomarina oriensis]